MIKGTFAKNEHAFDFVIGDNCVAEIVRKLVQYAGQDILLIADEVPFALHGEELIKNIKSMANVNVLQIVAVETAKTLSTVNDLLEQAVNSGATRETCVVSFGGGLTANVAGMVAGLLFRGVRLVHLPTTFLCASDGILSQKQAVNGNGGKNQFGLYLKPVSFLCDVKWLLTLPDQELAAGMVELAKNALAYDAPLLEQLEGMAMYPLNSGHLLTFIELAIRSKNKLMLDDPFERRKALILEYGHTVGHALELSQPNLPHGHAVALGARIAAQISARRGLLNEAQVARHDALIDKMHGMCKPAKPIDVQALFKLLIRDNKRGYISCKADEVPMILLSGLSEVCLFEELPLTPILLSEVGQAIAQLQWETTEPANHKKVAPALKAVRRTHGFGNVLNLLMLLQSTEKKEHNWFLVTRTEWVPVLQALTSDVQVGDKWDGSLIDLDQATSQLKPSSHRFDEFSKLLNLDAAVIKLKQTSIPVSWKQSTNEFCGKIVIAPEAGHPGRRWPDENIAALIQGLGPEKCLLVGEKAGAHIDKVIDLRGKTSLEQLFGVIANAQAIVTMDSGVLHIARWTKTPTVALFGSVDPKFRVLQSDRIHTLQSELPCSPCNKQETCDERYDCICSIDTDIVLARLSAISELSEAIFERIPPHLLVIKNVAK